MRSFIAIPVADEVKQSLSELQQPIAGVRWQQPGQLHLTLKFLGELKAGDIQPLQDKLMNISSPVFSISISCFGFFPDEKEPRVLWAGVKAGKSLTELHHKIEEVCDSMGFKADTHSFIPHITLARINGADKMDVMLFVNQHKSFEVSDVRIEEFVLFESKRSSGGAVYQPFKRFPLG